MLKGSTHPVLKSTALTFISPHLLDNGACMAHAVEDKSGPKCLCGSRGWRPSPVDAEDSDVVMDHNTCEATAMNHHGRLCVVVDQVANEGSGGTYAMEAVKHAVDGGM